MVEKARQKPDLNEILSRLKKGPISFKYQGKTDLRPVGHTLNLIDGLEDYVVIKKGTRRVAGFRISNLLENLNELFPGVDIDFESEYMDPYTLQIPTDELDVTLDLTTSEVPDADESMSDIISSVRGPIDSTLNDFE